MNVPILLHHLRNASGIVVRVQTEVEFLHPFLDCGLAPSRNDASHNIEPPFPRFVPHVELLLVFDSSLGCFATCLSRVVASSALAALRLFLGLQKPSHSVPVSKPRFPSLGWLCSKGRSPQSRFS